MTNYGDLPGKFVILGNLRLYSVSVQYLLVPGVVTSTEVL
jgi:hypothetical protein